MNCRPGWLRAGFPKENERYEWKEWRSLKSNISGRKGEDLVSYVSALANMDGGCIVIGVQDGTLAVTGIQEFADYTADNVVHRVLGKTPGLPSMGLRVQELRASDTGAVVWLVAVATEQEVAYLNHKGLDSKHYKGLVLGLLALGPQPRAKINAMLLPKLPAAIALSSQKTFIKNLLQDMVREQLIENAGGATQAALWRLKR